MISLADKWVHPTKGFEIDPHTLARHLGRVLRFGGAINTYYTVLQHSLLVSDMAGNLVAVEPRYRQVDPFRAAVLGLVHDGHEFLAPGDVPTDWKNAGIIAMQAEIDIRIRACLKVPEPKDIEIDLIKQADFEALVVEGNYMSPAALTLNPQRFTRPDLVERWKDVFAHVACPDPYLAFKRNWDADGYYVKRFTELFDVMMRSAPRTS